MTGRERIDALISGHEPDRIIYSPNIWQWFNHHKTQGTLPQELRECSTLLDAHLAIGEDCFSRNLATDHTDAWFGGFTTLRFSGVEVETVRNGFCKKVIYHTCAGELSEEFLFEHNSTTLVQTKFLLDDPCHQMAAFKEVVASKYLDFNKQKWDVLEAGIGSQGMNIFGDWCNPLKLFHLAANPVNTIYLLMDYPDKAQEIMEIHTQRCLDSVQQAVDGGIKAVMTMDNLDSVFFPPPYFEKYCVPFFQKLVSLCSQRDVKVFSHACGQIRELLPLCIKAGLDGLEGITPPPLGDIELYEAKQLTGGRFICNGGITPLIQEKIKSRQDCIDLTRNIFKNLQDRKSFVFSMSCNTAINTSYDVIRWFGDAARFVSKELFGN